MVYSTRLVFAANFSKFNSVKVLTDFFDNPLFSFVSEKPVTPVKPEKRELTEVDLFTPVTKQAQDLFGGKDVDSDAETETGDYDLGNEDDEEVTASDLPVTCEDAPVTSPIRCSCNECSKALKSMLGKTPIL